MLIKQYVKNCYSKIRNQNLHLSYDVSEHFHFLNGGSIYKSLLCSSYSNVEGQQGDKRFSGTYNLLKPLETLIWFQWGNEVNAVLFILQFRLKKRVFPGYDQVQEIDSVILETQWLSFITFLTLPFSVMEGENITVY